MDIVRTVTVTRSLDAVFAHLSDLTTTYEWDPGTVGTERVSGDGGPGSRSHNVSSFLGHETELDDLATQHTRGEPFALRGESSTVVASDTMTFMRSHTAEGAGSMVTHHAASDLTGVTTFVAPVLAPPLKRLGDDAEPGMRDALGWLGRLGRLEREG